jgi:hypothetical protein
MCICGVSHREGCVCITGHADGQDGFELDVGETLTIEEIGTTAVR